MAANIIGGIGGAVIGGLGSFFGAQSAERKNQRRRNQVRLGISEAEVASRGIAQEAVASRSFRLGRNFIQGLFSRGGSNPLIQSFQQNFRQASAARGTFFSPAGAADEARRSAALIGQFQLQALPQLMNLVGFQERFRQSIFPQIAETRVQFNTGGERSFAAPLVGGAGSLSPSSAALSGALQGFGTGSALGAQFGGSPFFAPDPRQGIQMGL